MAEKQNHNSEYLKIKEGRLRSFGRLASHMSPEDQKELEQTLKDIEVPEVVEGEPFSLSELFSKDIEGPLLMEVGMGMGDQLFARAMADKTTARFIGCEVYRNGLRKIARNIKANNLKNIRLYTQDARTLMDAMPEGCVDTLLLLYPDPWPKKKHHKRRIFNEDFIQAAEHILKDEGKLVIATDIVDYAFNMIEYFRTLEAFDVPVVSPADWTEEPEGWVQTKYEAKALREGRKPWYFTLVRKKR